MENLLFLGVPILKHIRVYKKVGETFTWPNGRCSKSRIIGLRVRVPLEARLCPSPL